MKALTLLIVPLLFLVSCAGAGSSNTERLLVASGFETRKPESAQQIEIYNRMEPFKLYNKEINGKLLFGYKDPKQGIVYVGGEKEHQQYQKYAVEQQLLQDQRMAAEMQMEAAYGWSTWSPYYRRGWY